MTNLTIAQFVEQINDENLDYALPANIITGTGIVCEEDETVLCTGEHIYNFIYADDSFDGEFTESLVAEYIEIMQSMS